MSSVDRFVAPMDRATLFYGLTSLFTRLVIHPVGRSIAQKPNNACDRGYICAEWRADSRDLQMES